VIQQGFSLDKIFKKGVFLLLIFSLKLLANQFVLNHSGLVDPRAIVKINQIGNEVKLKLNLNLYLDVKGDNGIDLNLPMKEKIKLMKKKEKELVKNLKKPYIILTMALDQMYVNILYSDEKLASIVNKDEILNDYVIPLLASKDKNSLKSKISAAVLNGYAEIADRVAKYKNIELKSSIGSSGKVAGTIWKIFMYSVVLVGIVLFTVIIMRERKVN